MAPIARPKMTTTATATTRTTLTKPAAAAADARPTVRTTAKSSGMAGKAAAARAVKIGVRGVGQKKGGEQEQEQEYGYEHDHDVSLDGADLLGVSSQLSSDTGNIVPTVAWSQAIADDIRGRHKAAAEKVIREAREEEARIFKRQKLLLEQHYAALEKLSVALHEELRFDTTKGIVQASAKRMAHEKQIEEDSQLAQKAIAAAVAQADEVGAECLKRMEAAVPEEELIGETAMLRLSASDEGEKTFVAQTSKRGSEGKNQASIVRKPVKTNSDALTTLRPAKKPRKTDDTLVGSDDEHDF